MKHLVRNGITYNIPEVNAETNPDLALFIEALAGDVPETINATYAPKASPVLTGTVGIPAYTLTTLPTVVVNAVIVVTNANSGAGTVCFGKGTNWIDIRTGAAVA